MERKRNSLDKFNHISQISGFDPNKGWLLQYFTNHQGKAAVLNSQFSFVTGFAKRGLPHTFTPVHELEGS